jgi:hypothetical protein
MGKRNSGGRRRMTLAWHARGMLDDPQVHNASRSSSRAATLLLNSILRKRSKMMMKIRLQIFAFKFSP